MGRTIFAGVAACALLVATPAVAASDYVQCDGQAKGMNFAEGLARFTMVLGTLGLFGSGEQDNVAERRFGAEGVAACTRAMDDGRGKGNDLRRSRLLLARAIHHVEAKNLDLALADVRQFPAAGGEKANDPFFLRSFALGAMELEAAILLRQGKTAEAEAVALRMAAASPYDLANMSRALAYLDRSAAASEARRAHFARLVRLMPVTRFSYAEMLRWSGDYAGSADQIGAVLAMTPDTGNMASTIASQAVDLYLAGKTADADRLAEQARTDNEARASIETTDVGRNQVTRTDDLLAFAKVAAAMTAGRTAEARKLFAARERWLAVPVPAVIDVTRRLRNGAAPAELTGALARDPDQLRSEALAGEVKRRTDDAALKALYRTIRPYLSPGSYNTLARDVNIVAPKSKYMPVKQDTLPGEVVRIPGGVAAGEGLLLHSARVARARGKAAFAFTPARIQLGYGRVLFEDPAATQLPRDALFDAATVIADLGPRFAPPPSR